MHGAVGQHAAVAEHDDPVCRAGRELDVVGDDEHAAAGGRPTPQQGRESALVRGVHAARRLIEHEQSGLCARHGGECHAGPFTAREVAWIAVAARG